MNELMNLCYGKRVAAIRRLQDERKGKMRLELPVLTREDVIRYRLPYHEAFIRSVQQEGFHNTAEYIKQLMDYQEYLRTLYGPESNLWMRPRLMKSSNILSHIKNGLVNAEKAHMAGDTPQELEEILKMAAEYAFGDENWWWLGHQMLEQSLLISKGFIADAGKYHAISRYILGKFLVEQISDNDAGLDHLHIAKNLSDGMTWCAKSIFKSNQQSVFIEVSILLHVVYLKKAKNCMKRDPYLAIKLCTLAKKSALDGCYYDGETEAHITQGKCEQMLYKTNSAIISFQKALAIQMTHENPKWKCESLCNLAVAYLKHGILSSALRLLHDLKDYATKHNLLFYVALSYKYLGEYYLREGTPQSSTPLLKTALNLFTEGGYVAESESTRNYAAISIGVELINSYIELVVHCVKTNPEYDSLLTRLLRWKDSRKAFWSERNYNISFTNFHDMSNEKNIIDQPLLLIDNIIDKEKVLSVHSLMESDQSPDTEEKIECSQFLKTPLETMNSEENSDEMEAMSHI